MARINNESVLKWQREHRPEMRVMDKRYTEKLRGQVLDRYGRVCAGCGTGKLLFVVCVSGQPVQPGMPTGRPVWRWLRDQGWPDGYVMMCQSCVIRARRPRAV